MTLRDWDSPAVLGTARAVRVFTVHVHGITIDTTATQWTLYGKMSNNKRDARSRDTAETSLWSVAIEISVLRTN